MGLWVRQYVVTTRPTNWKDCSLKKPKTNYGCLVSWQTEQKFPNTLSQMVNDTDRKMFKVLASILKLSDWYFKTIVGTPGSKV